MKKPALLLCSVLLLASCGAPGSGGSVSSAPASAGGGSEKELSFRVLQKGEVFTDFSADANKAMNLVAVRSDLTLFEHLRPTMASDGTWSIPHRFTAPGTYWLFADFTAADGSPHVMPFQRVVGTEKTGPALFGTENLLTAKTFAGVIGDVKVTIVPKVGDKDVTLDYSAEDIHGKAIPVESYLGAKGFSVLIGEDGSYWRLAPVTADTASFRFQKPKKGKYRLFTELKLRGQVVQVVSDVEI